MRFVIDLDSLFLTESASDRRPVTSVSGKRGDATPFEVIFVRAGIAEPLPVTTVLTFGAKKDGQYDAAAVVFEDDFTLSGSGPAAKYLANPSFNTTPLNALFLIDGNPSNDVPFVDLMAEFTWAASGQSPTSTKTFPFRVYNDVLRGDEGTPAALPDPADWMPAALTFAGADPNVSDALIISGTLTSDGSAAITFPSLFYSGIASGKAYYTNVGGGLGVITDKIQWSTVTNKWQIFKGATVRFQSSDAVATPDLVTTWLAVSPATGTDVDVDFGAGLAATHLGQLCKASTAWWRWNGTAWIEEIPDASLTIAKTAGLQAALDGKYYPPITSLAFMGDSITAASTSLTAISPEYFSHQDFINAFSLKDIPVIPNGTNKSFGVGGSTSSGWLSTQVTQILALGTKPSHVVVMIGTNDVGTAGNTLPIATTLSNLTTGTASLRAANVEPIFCIFPGSVGTYEKTSHNGELGNAIVRWGAANNVFIIDERPSLNDPVLVGRDNSGGLYDNLHPYPGWYMRFGKAAAAKLAPALASLPSPFDHSAPINPNPYNASNLGAMYAPDASVYSASGVTYGNRPDGITGRWARLEMAYKSNRAMTLGSGNGAVTYAAVAPWTEKQIFVDTQFIETSTDLVVTVFPQTSMVLIRVKLKVSGGVSTAAQVAAAVNAVASSYVTATAGGTGADSALSGALPTRWQVYGTPAPESPEAGLLENDQIRLVAEFRVLSGELASFGATLFRNAPSFLTVYSAALPLAFNNNTVGPGSFFVFKTNWFTVGSNGSGGPMNSRFVPMFDVGGRDCVLEIGRIFVQRRAAP